MTQEKGHRTREQYLKEATKVTEKNCAYCGKPMYRKIFSSGRREDHSMFLRRKYCDIECMKRAFVVQGKDTGQTWTTAHHSARSIMRLFSDKECKCEKCRSTRNVEIHHIDGNPQNNTIENLMYLCRSCHIKTHRPKSICKICGKPMDGGYGYCNKHYLRWKKIRRPTNVLSQNSK